MKLKIKPVFCTAGSYSSSISNSEHHTGKSEKNESRGCQNLLFSLRQQNNYEQVIISIKSEKKKKTSKVWLLLPNPFHTALPTLSITASSYGPGTAPFLFLLYRPLLLLHLLLLFFIFISSVPKFS